MSNQINTDDPAKARNTAMVALALLRRTIQAAAPGLKALPHVHGLLAGLDADLGRADDVLTAGGGVDLLDRVGLLLQAADDGEIQPGGGLSGDAVGSLVLAAREASVRLGVFLALAR